MLIKVTSIRLSSIAIQIFPQCLYDFRDFTWFALNMCTVHLLGISYIDRLTVLPQIKSQHP